MAKFYGPIGYGDSAESPPNSGIWKDVITEVYYYGDVIRNTTKLQGDDTLNSDITIGNSISVLADEYANAHFFNIKYVGWSGALWNVTNVEVQSPRLILRLGSVYSGPTP